MMEGLVLSPAEWLGAGGYGLMLLATLMVVRRRLIWIDLSGLSLVSLHWVWMGVYSGAALNSLFIVNDALALSGRLDHDTRKKGLFLGTLILIASILTVRTWVDVLPAVGAALVFIGIQSTDMVRLRGYMALAGFFWGSFGWLAGSKPQVAFSIIVTAIHAYHWLRLIKMRDKA